jgi:predicted nucleic acid-binding protein
MLTATRQFLLDADVFIAAARRYYAFDLAPRFWQELIAGSNTGQVASIDKVKEELLKGNDALARWAKDRFGGFLSTDSSAVVQAYGQVMNWAEGQNHFTEAALEDFASGADGWLAAFAIANQCTIVTNEVSAPPEKKSKIKIPNVCQQFGVHYVDTFRMLRELKIRFS